MLDVSRPETVIGFLYMFGVLWGIAGIIGLLAGAANMNWLYAGAGLGSLWIGFLSCAVGGIWGTLERIARK